MAWTRVGQIGAEHQTTAEWLINGSTQPTISSTKARTGTYSMRHTLDTSPVGKSFTGAVMMRAGVWLNHNSASSSISSHRAYIFQWPGANGSIPDGARWNNNLNELQLRINNTQVDEIAETTGDFTNTDQWFHCGIVVYANASTGWASFYLDGVKVLSATGQNTAASIAACYAGGYDVLGWSTYAYFDDFYVDTSTSEEADEAPPFYRFGWRIANGAGTNTEWTPNTGANYAAVDDAPHDSDTTYVYAESSGLQDSYNTSSFSVPTGYVVTAEIASVVARKTGAGEQLKLGFTDGTNESLSAAQDLSAGYSILFSRHTTQPDTTDWNETDGDAMEIMIESAGSFS